MTNSVIQGALSVGLFAGGQPQGQEGLSVRTSARDAAVELQPNVFGFSSVGTLTIETTLMTGNSVAVRSNPGNTVRLSNNGVYDNQTAFFCGGGVLLSQGNNRKVGNVLAGCSPNGTITLQ